MRAELGKVWDNATSSLWFIPSLLVIAAIVLSSVLLNVDEALGPELAAVVGVLFGGTADSARSLLSTVATSLITVVSVAFSITLVALQQAANQYSPRVLRNFTKDKGNQVVLGTYLGTFAYSLLVMRQIREPTGDQDAFVPALSITTAVALALVSIGLLVYYIGHISASLQVPNILASIRLELRQEIDQLFPSQIGRESRDPPDLDTLLAWTVKDRQGHESVIHSERSGYLRHVDADQLEEATPRGVHLVVVKPRIGDYLHPHSELARVWSERPLGTEESAGMRAAFPVDRSRSLRQNPTFGITQLVDIGVRALSPSLNDPTTAEQSLSILADAILQMEGKEFPSPLRLGKRGTPYLFNRPTFADFVDVSFSEIRRAGKDNVRVTLHLLGILGDLATQAPGPERAAPLRQQVEEVLAALRSSNFTSHDRQRIEYKAKEVLAVLQQTEGRTQEAA